MNPGLRSIFYPFLILLSLFTTEVLAAGGIRGTITNARKEPLPFASIVVKNTSLGTMSNADARYELTLNPGKYEIIFQYLGYQTVVQPVEVREEYVQLDVVLQDQTVTLQEFQVKARKEDPAYTIMRKAIAKSRFHILQVQSYAARVYTRGGGRLTDSPFFLRNKLKKEGIDPNTVYFTESVADVFYQQNPRVFRQKVLSIRSNMEKFASPNDYLQASFYNPLIAGAVSPLSPKAFAYYKFQYLGIFKDRGFEVNKIRVTPRSKGDNVFEGDLYIIEDLWSIHSLNFFTMKSGFRFDIKQLSAPVNQVWMPISNQIEVKGSYLGFEGEFKYLASVSNYNLKINPAFTEEVKIIDEKVEKPAPVAAPSKADKTTATLEEALAQKKELRKKDLNKLIRAYEKQEEKERQKKAAEPRVVRNDSTVIDSLAYRRDSTYWNEVRTVPLTRMEVESFTRRDSINQREEAKATSDSLKTNTNKFQWSHLLGGHNYRLSKSTRIDYRSPVYSAQFNTVEGWAFHTSLRLTHSFKDKNSVYLRPLLRYSFAREKLTGTLRMGYKGAKSSFFVEAGQYVSQFNPDDPIHPLVNTLWTLFFESNYMKLYEKKFLALNYQRKVMDGLSMKGNLEWADRFELANGTSYTLIRYRDRAYTSNVPLNEEQDQELIAQPQALTFNFNATYQPWVRYSIRNGKKRAINDDSPSFGLHYRKGLSSLLGSQVDYDLMELSLRHAFNVGIRGRLFYGATVGTFLNNRALSFPDYRHLAGNLTVLQTGDLLTCFRLLDYYRFSTASNYWHGHALYQFRKFLITRIPLVRMTGIKEAVFAHYLYTDRSQHYWEVGYTLNGILRLFRVEAVASFQGNQYQSFGIRIGLVLNGLKINERED